MAQHSRSPANKSESHGVRANALGDSRDKRLQGLSKCFCFDDLSEDALKEVAESADLRQFKRGEYILHEGDPPTFFQVILEGRVKVYKQSTSGKDVILGVVTVGQALNGVVLFEPRPHSMSAQALDDVTIVRVRREDYLALVKRYPTVALKIIGMLDKILDTAYNRLVDVVGETAEQRVCNALYMLNEKFGNELDFTTEAIGDLAGIRTETAIRILGKLKELRVIDSPGRGKLRILSPVALKSLSRGPFYI